MTVLVTGAKGMIGSQLVEGLKDAGYDVVGIDRIASEGITQVDLADRDKLKGAAKNSDRIIHLAALAHTTGEKDLSWERYKHANIICAKNVFEIADDRPVLFISTVDVFGFYDGKNPVNGDSIIRPVSKYGKSKALAEAECRKLKHYTIFRFSPVYTEEIKRDIQKRYYLKYPNIAYKIGKGSSYEILNIKKAVQSMIDWCREEPQNEIRIIKDSTPMWTPDYISEEKRAGRARITIWIPRWMAKCFYTVLKKIFCENEKLYLLNKAVYPLVSGRQ